MPLPDDPLISACVLTYISDICTGLAGLHDAEEHAGSSLDHAIWFHRPHRMDDWVLINLTPTVVNRGRGYYTGSVHDRAGRLVADIMQEALFRSPRPGR